MTTPTQDTGRDRKRLSLFLLGGLIVAFLLAGLVSGFASGDPDGLERVAEDKGFLGTAEDHAFADGPLADYGVEGVDDERASVGLAGLIGVTITFALGLGVFAVVKRRKGDDAPRPDSTG